MEPFWIEVEEPTLRQGDYLRGCMVPVFDPSFTPGGETPTVLVDEFDLIVVTQSCDCTRRSMQDWVAASEALFNLGAGEVPCNFKRHEVVNYCYNFPDLQLCFGWHGHEDELAARFKNCVPEFRRKYYLKRAGCKTVFKDEGRREIQY